MSETKKMNEEQVFMQEVSDEELNAVAGGGDADCGLGARSLDYILDADRLNCINAHKRNIYGGNGFPNCAATVEDGSLCSTNDACAIGAVVYSYFNNLQECKKAHR